MPKGSKGTGQPTIGTHFDPSAPTIDWDKALQDFDKEVKILLQQLRDELETEFNVQAANRLDNTSQKYMEGVTVEVAGDNITATIEGWFPLSVERGVGSPFDMKPGLLKNQQSRVIKMHDGEFRTVSLNSPRDSWWHPARGPRGIGYTVKQKAPGIAKNIFEPFLKRIKI